MKTKSHYILKGFVFLFCVTLCAQRPPKTPKQANTTPKAINYNSPSNSEINETLKYVNNLLRNYNDYSSSFEVNLSKGEVSFIDEFSILTAKYYELEYYNSSNNIGFRCKDGSDCLKQKDFVTKNTLDPKSSYSLSIKSDGEKMIYETNVMIGRLNNMLDEMGSSSSNYGSGNSATLNRHLKTINDAFQKYNSYNSVFSVSGNRLYLDNSVSNFSAELSGLTFYIHYKNKWMVLKCIEDGCFDGTSFTDEYSMALKTSSGEISPVMEDVLDAFNNIRREVLSK